MKTISNYIVLLVAALSLHGCSFQRAVQLLPAMTPEFCPAASQQQWSLSWQGSQSRLMVVTQCEDSPDGGRWQWFLLNQLGQRIATAYNSERQVVIEYAFAHQVDKLVPQLVEAWQLTEFNLITLQAQSGGYWSFTEQANQRRIGFSGILRAEINYPTENASSEPLMYTADDFRVVIYRQSL